MPSETDVHPRHPGAGSFAIGPASAPKVLLFHGLTGAPSELWPLGLALAAAGYRVEAPVLPGHGTTPRDLARVSAQDVVAAARQHAADQTVEIIGGLSMGALLSLIVASERPQTKGLVLMATALRLSGRNFLAMEAMRLSGLSRLPLLLPKGAPDVGVDTPIRDGAVRPDFEMAAARAAETADRQPGADGRYDRIPSRWGREMFEVQRLAATAAPKVACPVLMMHGLRDQTASSENVPRATALLTSRVRVRVFAESPHLLMLGPERGTIAAEVVRFLNEVVPVAAPGDVTAKA
jgi:carboxylesterase